MNNTVFLQASLVTKAWFGALERGFYCIYDNVAR